VLINALPLFRWLRVAPDRPHLAHARCSASCGWAPTPRLLRRALRGANGRAIPERELREIYAHFDFGTQRAILKL